MSKKHRLRQAVITAIKHNKDGAYRTQADRRQALLHIADTLHGLGYTLDHLRFLKPKHIQALVTHWQTNGHAPGTLKNRLSHLRWLMQTYNNRAVIPSNDALGIPKRVYVATHNKAVPLTQAVLDRVKDPWMQYSLQGQALFGLRVETSLKIQPHAADVGHALFIQQGWAKGGRDTLIPIRTPAQRDWVDRVKQAVPHTRSALIPAAVSYKTYRARFNKVCERAGLPRRHGLRHLYAQTRYHTLTGWSPPVNGGPRVNTLTPTQQRQDRAARLQISQELGHSRAAILASYLGR